MVYCKKFADVIHTQECHAKINMCFPKAMLNCWSP